jgi:hypothetical protein
MQSKSIESSVNQTCRCLHTYIVAFNTNSNLGHPPSIILVSPGILRVTLNTTKHTFDHPGANPAIASYNASAVKNVQRHE